MENYQDMAPLPMRGSKREGHQFIQDKDSSLPLSRKRQNLHKIYLTISLFLGVLLALAMPLFSEPDGQYHYVVSSNMVGLSPDMGKMNEDVGSGISRSQIRSYQDGSHFRTYYESQVPLTSIENLPRANQIPSPFKLFAYDFWGHLIPAAGIWLGYHLYPSVGVEIGIARLLSLLVFSLFAYGIIKRVREGKLLFMLICLSPTVLGSFASLSYDSLSVILVLAALALAINTLSRDKISEWTIPKMLVLTVLLLVMGKNNFMFVALIYPVILFYFVFRQGKRRENHHIPELSARQKRLMLQMSMIIIGLGLLASVFVFAQYGGLSVVQRLISSFAFKQQPTTADQDTILNVFVSPYVQYNWMPIWLTGAWFILFSLALFSTRKFVRSFTVSLSALILFGLMIISIYVGFIIMGYGSWRSVLGAASGQQGRYITPGLLLLVLFAASQKIKLKVGEGQVLIGITIGLGILSNLLLLMNTLVGVYLLPIVK